MKREVALFLFSPIFAIRRTKMDNKIYLSLVLATACILLGGLFFSATAEDNIRQPAVAGSFYPGSESELRAMITKYFNSTPDEKPAGDILAAVAPHAGYVYSGAVAARTFKQLAGVDFDTIVIIGHEYSYKDYVAFISPADYFKTPLGLVPVDKEMVEKMLKFNKGIISNEPIHSQDHSIEIQLSFLQVLGKKCKIVPIIFGNSTVKNCQILAGAIIAAAGDKKVFVLSSTDMSHYPSYEDANRVDKSTLEIIKTMDVVKIFSHLDAQENRPVSGLQTALCSRGGLGTAIFYAKARGADQAQVLRYANSGDVSIGDKSGVVGYSSVLFVKKTEGETQR
jgi:MEMO1 family protein